MKHHLSTFLVLLLLSSAAIAASEQKRTCRILFLQRPAQAPTSLFLFDGKESREVELPGMNLSGVYEISAEASAISLLNKPLDDPAQLPANAPTARIPASFVDFYLLLISDPSNLVAPVKMQVVDAGHERLKNGQMLWLNLTNLTIGGQLGTRKVVVKPRGLAVMEAPVSGSGNYPVNLAYCQAGKDRYEPICQTRWVQDPRARSLAFVIKEEEVALPRVIVVEDIRP